MRAIRRILAGIVGVVGPRDARPGRKRRPDGGRRAGDTDPFSDPERRAEPPDRRRSLARVRRSPGRRRRTCADRRVQSGGADADHPARRLRRARCLWSRKRGEKGDGRPGGPVRTADPVGGGLEDRRHGGRGADRSLQAVACDLRAARPQSGGQARLREGEGRRRHRPAGRNLPHRVHLSRHGRRTLPRFGRRPKHRQIGGAGAADDAAHELDRQRRHQGGVGQAGRRDPAPSLRDADAQARQQTGWRGSRQLDLHRAHARRGRDPRTDRRLPLARPGGRANMPSSPATTPRPTNRPSR